MRKGRGSGDLYRRLEALENDFDDEPVTLYFADGRRETLSSERLLQLFGSVLHPETVSQADQRKLDSVNSCIRAHEPGGGHMVELLRAIQQSPV
jgi:hypothetical protein